LKRSKNLPVMALRIEPQSACQLYLQLYNQLRQAILEQKLPVGTRLPSTRAMACTFGLSRNTVLNAYEALVGDGLLVARKGSGTHVSLPSDTIRSLATPMLRTFDLWAALREARFPATSVFLCDPDGNRLYVHR
jgi:DNA-binding transcriptional regulator YhcF (GntR family)